MADSYAILKLKKFHTFPQLHSMQVHHNREIVLPHVRYEDTINNVILIDAGESYIKAWQRRLAEAEVERGEKIKFRQDAVLFFELVLTFSEGMDINIKEWANANVVWLKNTFKEDNILACTLHLDEHSPHIHADIIPIDERNHLCMKAFINGPASLYKLQNAYAKEMAVFGLKRGERHTKTKGTTLDQFYQSVNKVEKNPPPKMLEDESEEAYIVRLQDHIKTMEFAIANLKKQAKRTEEIINTRIANHYADYADAIKLQYCIMDNMDDEENTKNRLRLYKQLEMSMPRQELDKVLSFLAEKYPVGENILSLEQKNNPLF